MKKVIISGLIGLSLLSLFLAKDYLFKSSLDEQNLGAPLAVVLELNNELKYKHATSVFWDVANRKQKLFNGSEIFTGANSQAVIEMKDKSSVRMPEETLLRIIEDKSAPGGLALNLDKGSLQINGSGKGLKVKLGGTDFELGSEKGTFGVYIKKDLGGALTLSVSSGSLELKSGDQKKTLGTGEALKLALAAEGPPQPEVAPTEGTQGSVETPKPTPTPAPKLVLSEVESEKIELLNPPHQKILYGETLEFFKWKINAEKNISLEISSAPDFSTDLNKIDVSGLQEYVIPKDLRPGAYYWRVIATDQGIPQFSETRIFKIELLQGNEVLAPQLQFRERGKWQLIVPVKDAKAGEQFHFQISRNRDFTDIYDEYQGPQPLKSLMDESGDFYTRVRKSYDGGNYSTWSQPVQVHIRPPLATPELTKSSEELNSNEQVEAKLTWSDVPFAVDYLIQLSETPKFGMVVKNVVVAQSPYVLRHTLPQPTYMRLIARSAEGEYSPPSQSFKMKGLLKGPAIEKKEVLPSLFEKADSSPQLHLLWSHRPDAKKYKVEVSRDPKLAGSEISETDNVEFFKNVSAEGWYYFRVWSVGDAEKFHFAPTPTLAVSFSKPGNLITPNIMSPKNNEVFLVPRGIPVSIKFTWSESPHNEWYSLELSQNKLFKNTIEHRVEGQEFVLKSAIKNGQWYFRVRGRNKYQASPWSETGVFYFGVSK